VAGILEARVSFDHGADASNGKTQKTHGYAPVNGLEMYYEIEGTGDPLVYVPPAFGIAGSKSFPALAESHRIISVAFSGEA
jgi:hypothetical protein